MKKFAAIAVLVTWSSLTGAQTLIGTNLVGEVTSPVGSAPATVLVMFARPRPGAIAKDDAFLRLPRQVQVAADGKFTVPAISPAWLYQVHIIAPHCRTKSFESVDPLLGPVYASLELANTNRSPDTFVRGKVVDSHGNPVPGALIKILRVIRKDQPTLPPTDLDPFAVTDEAGCFIVGSDNPLSAIAGSIEAPGFATDLFENWGPGEVHKMTLGKGAAFKGRLLCGGQPVANADIRLGDFGAKPGTMLGTTQWRLMRRANFYSPIFPRTGDSISMPG